MKSVPSPDPENYEERIIQQPARLLTHYCHYHSLSPSYEMGVLAVGLELESQARIFEAISGTSLIALNREELSGALRTLLRSLGIDDDVQRAYVELIKFEDELRPKYRAIDEEGRYLGSFDGVSGTLPVKEPQP